MRSSHLANPRIWDTRSSSYLQPNATAKWSRANWYVLAHVSLLSSLLYLFSIPFAILPFEFQVNKSPCARQEDRCKKQAVVEDFRLHAERGWNEMERRLLAVARLDSDLRLAELEGASARPWPWRGLIRISG
jgi:hypothetical protein